MTFKTGVPVGEGDAAIQMSRCNVSKDLQYSQQVRRRRAGGGDPGSVTTRHLPDLPCPEMQSDSPKCVHATASTAPKRSTRGHPRCTSQRVLSQQSIWQPSHGRIGQLSIAALMLAVRLVERRTAGLGEPRQVKRRVEKPGTTAVVGTRHANPAARLETVPTVVSWEALVHRPRGVWLAPPSDTFGRTAKNAAKSSGKTPHAAHAGPPKKPSSLRYSEVIVDAHLRTSCK